jgi:L-lactate dehydrogenase complex protein LldG
MNKRDNENRRAAVLGAIRSRLGVQEADKTRQLSVQSRLEQHRINTQPALGQLQGEEKLQRFKTEATAKGVTVHQCEEGDIAATLQQIAASYTAVHATSAVRELGLGIDFAERTPRSSVDCCVSTCFCAIAETGTIVLHGDKMNPTSEVFLADLHVVLLPERDVESNMEAVWQRTRTADSLPRHLTMVSGPSSTGDIEMQLEKGVHGPRDLQVILWSSS